MVKSRIISYWFAPVIWFVRETQCGCQGREALVASTPKVARSPHGRMGTKAGLTTDLVIFELSISPILGDQSTRDLGIISTFQHISNIYIYPISNIFLTYFQDISNIQTTKEIGHRLHHLQKAVSGKGSLGYGTKLFLSAILERMTMLVSLKHIKTRTSLRILYIHEVLDIVLHGSSWQANLESSASVLLEFRIN